MLTRVTAIEFQRAAVSGKSRPSFITCQREDGTSVEVVAKFSANCERGVTSLAIEVVSACLAGDLGLPIPEPFLVDAPTEWSDLIPDSSQRSNLKASSPVAFGSRVVTGQFSLWNAGNRLNASMIPAATAIFAFDGIIQNPDRRIENPNCFVRGNDLRIFDHELAFAHGLVLGWLPPWAEGGLKPFETPGFHIFREELKSGKIDFDVVSQAWSELSDGRIDEYGGCLPSEWAAAHDDVEKALSLINHARDNIEDCIVEIKRVLA